MAINSISINAIIGSLLKRKRKEVEIAKEVFRRQAKVKEKLSYIRGQKNTISRNNRQENSLIKDIDINSSGNK